jgi:hypothetical protein
VKSPTSSISIIVKSVIKVIVMMKKSILLLSDAEVCSILVSLPMSKGAIEFRVLPVDRKNSFAFKLSTEDREVTWCIDTTDAAVILWVVLVMVPGGTTVMTDKVVVGISGYDGDTGCGGRHWGCRVFMIMVGKVGRGRSGGACNSCSMGVSGRTSVVRSSERVRWFVKWRSRFLQHLQCSHHQKRHSA